MSDKYFTQPSYARDGDVAEAKDVNTINDATEAAFVSLEDDLDVIQEDLDIATSVSKAWAVGPGEPPVEDDEVEPGLYSSSKYASNSKLSSTVSASSASASATSASESLASKNAASISEANSSISASASNVSALASEASNVASGLSASASATSASESATSATASQASAVASDTSAIASGNSATASNLSASLSASSATDSENSAIASEASAVASLASEVASASSATASALSASEALASADSALSEADRAEGYADNIGTLPMVASSVLTNWTNALNLATAQTLNFATVLYTGNGTTQDIVTGIDSVDFTVAFNGSGYWLDRTVNQIKDDAGTVVASGTANWGNTARGVSKIHIKGRSVVKNHSVFDGLRGVTKNVGTDVTHDEQTTLLRTTSFNNDGFSISSSTTINTNLATYVAYQELYTHISWGTTNQGKFYVEAYNPITGKVMIYYIGSGVAGHEIPHSQGVALDYVMSKNLTSVRQWLGSSTLFNSDNFLRLNETDILASAYADGFFFNTNNTSFGPSLDHNEAGSEHILYGARKSQQWTIVEYTGTGASGNYVELGFKASRVIVKAVSTIGNWLLYDNKRPLGGANVATFLNLDTSNTEATSVNLVMEFDSNGVSLGISSASQNASGEHYILIAQADTNADGGGSYYPRPTDGLLNVNGGFFNYTNGLDEKGYTLSSRTVTKSLDTTGLSDGFKWVSENSDGTVSWFDEEPTYTGEATGVSFSTADGLWYEDNVLMSPYPSFIPVPVMVSGGAVQYLGDDEVAQSVMESLSVGSLKVTDGFDLGQTWQDVKSERALGITYTNSTSKPIMVSISFTNFVLAYPLSVNIDGSRLGLTSTYTGGQTNMTFTVPVNSTYSTDGTSNRTLAEWRELR